MEGEQERFRKTSVFSRLFILWVLPVIATGTRKRFEKEDVPKLEKSLDSEPLMRRAVEEWKRIAEQPPHKRSYFTLTWRLQWKLLMVGICLSVVQGLLFSVARPLLLRQVILRGSNLSIPPEDSVGLIMAFVLAVLVEGILQGCAKQVLCGEFSSTFYSWTAGLLAWKAVRIDSTSPVLLRFEATGLIGHDLTRLVDDWRWGSMVFANFVSLIGGICVLASTLKVASLPGFGIMLVIFMFNFRLGKVLRRIEERGHGVAMNRIKLTQDLASNILGVKLASWEGPYEQLLSTVREQDAGFIKHARILGLTSINLGRISPVLASSLSVVTLAYVSPDELNAATIFTALVAFNGLRLPLISLPQAYNQYQNAKNSFAHFLRFLNADEFTPPQLSKEGVYLLAEGCSFAWSEATQPFQSATLEARRMSFRRRLASWKSMKRFEPEEEDEENVEDKEVETTPLALSNISLLANNSTHRLVAVVGVVASGKSSLLRGLLGHLPQTKGRLELCDHVGYVPQKPFIISGSILDNILMGAARDETKLQLALKVSDLCSDMNQFKDGLETRIGERGQTLSGGQKARLSLARALMMQPKLLMLDDPLAAVDGRVANVIFEGIVNHVTRSGDCACVMVLNQLHFLPRFDYVYVLKDGEIAEHGPYAEVKHQPFLKRLLEDLPNVNEDDTLVTNTTVAVATTTDGELGAEQERDEEQPATTLLVQEEQGSRGQGVSKIIRAYLRRMGLVHLPIALLLGTVAYSIMAANDLLLAFWIQEANTYTFDQNVRRAFLYLGLACAQVVGIECLSLWNMIGSVKASKRLHADVVNTLLHAPTSFYESTPSGRIVGRLSGDLNSVDRPMSFVFDDFFHFGFNLIATSVTVAIIIPPLFAFMVLSIGLFVIQVFLVDRTNRETKRFANQALAPTLTNLAEIAQGRSVIQSNLSVGECFFLERHHECVNEYNKFALLSSSIVNLGTMITGLISFIVAAGAAFLVIFQRETVNPSIIGLALVYSQTQPYLLQILSVVVPIGLSCLTSLERVLEFCSDQIPREAEWESALPNCEWPQTGRLEFDNVCLVYRPSLPPSLINVSLQIEDGQVVGIVGRTGAGKSSLLVALMRIQELSSGRILIDGQDCALVGLQTLRKCIIVIPQEPVLLQGSVRFNLDPFNTYTTEEIETVVKRVGLDDSTLAKESSSLLSAGERQLVQMVRAILQKQRCRIVVLDEPSSNVDTQTDKMLDLIVRQEFVGKTRLVIAHRLSTVLHSDRILVMKKGTVAEFDSPQALLSNPIGEFTAMVNAYNEAHRV
ncbi:hypothetical protein BASA81_001926 [Batrachochytrium salamandrivorans]|nr:hypothetical protein BASA81_001926 [Batrachochytrium salamandrivorans]